MRRVALVLVTMALALLLASSVAWAVTKIGTDGPDTLRGTNGKDNLLGKGGNDEFLSRNGRDFLLGGAGRDCLLCVSETWHVFAGDKNLLGGPGNDWLWAGRGSDDVVGGEGNDLLLDSPNRVVSKNRFSGGPGNDVIQLQYRSPRDLVVCGSGFDRVAANSNDVVASDCEKVVVQFRGQTHSEHVDILTTFYEKTVPQNFYEGLPPCFSRYF
jgi:Ca2+-binding RTX toxin-like protein